MALKYVTMLIKDANLSKDEIINSVKNRLSQDKAISGSYEYIAQVINPISKESFCVVDDELKEALRLSDNIVEFLSLKTINGQSLIGDGDIIIQSSNVDTSSLETELAEVRASNVTLNSQVSELTTKMGKLFQVFPDTYLDELLRWRPANTAEWSNVFGGSSVATGDVIRFNNQKSAFLAPEGTTGIKFKLRSPNNPGGYILWLICSVNSSNQSDVRALTMDFQTYIEATYTSWIKANEGHTRYNGSHGATASNIKEVFNAHNLEITVLIEDGKIKCSNAVGFRFEINPFAGSGFVNRLGIGSQNGFSNSVEAYDIKVLTN